MITLLLHLLRLLPFLFGGHRQLALENLALRHQLAVYKRTANRPKLQRSDRRGFRASRCDFNECPCCSSPPPCSLRSRAPMPRAHGCYGSPRLGHCRRKDVGEHAIVSCPPVHRPLRPSGSNPIPKLIRCLSRNLVAAEFLAYAHWRTEFSVDLHEKLVRHVQPPIFAVVMLRFTFHLGPLTKSVRATRCQLNPSDDSRRSFRRMIAPIVQGLFLHFSGYNSPGLRNIRIVIHGEPC
jgi:hypothetical protein